MSNTQSMNVSHQEEVGCRACCSCPHSLYTILPCILAVAGVLLSQHAAFYCDFIDVNEVGALGLNTYEAQDEREDSWNQCVLYTKEDLDILDFGAAWQAGRSFAIIAFAVGFILMVVTLCASCVAFKPIVIRFLALGFAFCCLSQGLVFVALSTDFCSDNNHWYTCELAGGSIVGIIAVVVWFATAVAMAKMPSYNQVSSSNDQERTTSDVEGPQEMAPSAASNKPAYMEEVSF